MKEISLVNRRFFLLLYPALLLAVILPSLLDLGYWKGDTEVLLLCCASIIVGLAIGFFATKRTLVNKLILALLVYFVLDAFFLSQAWLAVLLAIAVFFLLQSNYQENVQSMLLTFAIVWTVMALLQPNKESLDQSLAEAKKITQQKNKAELPIILHLILDEQMSPVLAGQQAVKKYQTDQIMADYVSNGFVFYSDAQSTSSMTQLSLSDLFAMGEVPAGKNVREGRADFTHELVNNHYFDFLRKTGYRVVTVQSNFLRLCNGQQEATCFTYSRAGQGHSMSRFNGQITDRLEAAMHELHYRFYERKTVASVGLYRKTAKIIRDTLGVSPDTKAVFYLRPVTVLNVLDD